MFLCNPSPAALPPVQVPHASPRKGVGDEDEDEEGLDKILACSALSITLRMKVHGQEYPWQVS